jgi:hypothetical protein
MRERDREKWELENFKEGEVREMVEIYKGKGMAEEHAELVMRVCAKYEDLFVDMMLVDELGINPPDDDDSWLPHVKEGLVAFSSFCVFGFVPIAAYCIVGTASEDVDSRALFIISCVITCVMLFALGGALRPRAAPSPRRPSAPLWPAHDTPPLPCGLPAHDGISVVFSQKWCSFFPYAFKCILMHSDAFSTISLHSIPLHSSPAAWHCILLHFDAFTYVAFWYWCICLPSYAFSMLHLVQGAFVCIQMHPFLDAFS